MKENKDKARTISKIVKKALFPSNSEWKYGLRERKRK